jgi:hypothetical protein
VTLASGWLIAVSVLILGAGAWISVDTLRLQTAKAQIALLSAQVAGAKNANDSNLSLIASQRASLASWASVAAKQVLDAQTAVALLAQEQAAHAKTAAALNALQAHDRALPACTALMAVNLATVCPGTAQALKQRAQ